MRQSQGGKHRCIWDEVGRTGVSGMRWEGSFRLDTWAPSSNAILQFKAPQHPVRLVCPDTRDAHFDVADGSSIHSTEILRSSIFCISKVSRTCGTPHFLGTVLVTIGFFAQHSNYLTEPFPHLKHISVLLCSTIISSGISLHSTARSFLSVLICP